MKTILITLICLFTFLCSFGGELTKKEARKLLDKALTCLKHSDSVGFAGMYFLDGHMSTFDKRPFNKEDVIGNFNELKIFLDTVLAQNLKISYMDVEKLDQKESDLYGAPYKIKAWFRYTKAFDKGFGFFMDYKEGRWVFRFSPDYSIQYHDK